MKKSEGKDRLLDVNQVADRLGVAPSTVYNMIRLGRLSCLSVGAKKGYRIRAREVDKILNPVRG